MVLQDEIRPQGEAELGGGAADVGVERTEGGWACGGWGTRAATSKSGCLDLECLHQQGKFSRGCYFHCLDKNFPIDEFHVLLINVTTLKASAAFMRRR